jgi:hypothetical protein
MDKLYEKYKLERFREQIRIKQEKIRTLRSEADTAWNDYCKVMSHAEEIRSRLRDAREFVLKQLTNVTEPSPDREHRLAAVRRLSEEQVRMDRIERSFAKTKKCDWIAKQLHALLPNYQHCDHCGVELSIRELLHVPCVAGMMLTKCEQRPATSNRI